MKTFYPRFWKSSRQGPSAGVSLFAHVLVVTLSVLATLPAADVEPGSLANRVYYIPPPNRTPSQAATRETLHFVELAPPGDGIGLGVPGVGRKAKPPAPDEGNAGHDSASTPPADSLQGTDSVFTRVEVDTVAVRLPESAAPKYPRDMLEQKIQGSVLVQFVVDTTGFADVASFKIVIASRPEFAESIREALPEMRFAAARIGAEKVRQLVELPFSFHIAVPLPLPPVETKVVRRRP